MLRLSLLGSVLIVPLVGCRATDSGVIRAPAPAPIAASGPVVYSPGLVSTGLAERDASFSPDGDIFAFTQLDGRDGTIVLLENGELRIAPFSGTYSDLEPFFDPRGGVLWFASKRPHPDDPERSDWNIWRVAITEGGWGEPSIVRGLDEPGDEFYATVSLDGVVAFTSEREGGMGGEDIWLALPDGDGWLIENPGPGVNTPGPEFNALLTPGGDALIFTTLRRDDPRDQGGGDLYLSLGPDWGPAVPLVELNSSALDYCPALTPDGRRLIFTSRRRIAPAGRSVETLAALRARLARPGNGQDDLWWAPAPAVLTQD